MTSTTRRIEEESQRDPDVLEREAEEAREEISHTMEELEHRLSPGQYLDRLLAMGKEHGGEFAANVGRQIKYHPIPLVLTAIGISWLAMAENRPVGDGAAGGAMSDQARRAGDTARSALGGMREKAAGLSQSMHESAGSLRRGMAHTRESLRDQSARVRERFEHTLSEQPLVLGALGLALGAIIGGAMPRSEVEQRTVGRYGERLRREASETAEATREAASETLQEEARHH